MIPFNVFLKNHRKLSHEGFLAKVQVPYLLVESGLKLDKSSGFATVKFTQEILDDASVPPSKEVLFAVKKRAGSNVFGMMITMGRANNNDLVIPDKRISKFHAYFRQTNGKWTICDANSRNGTFVDGIPVPTDQGMIVPSGSRIKLAKTLEVVFLEPESLYERIRSSERKDEKS